MNKLLLVIALLATACQRKPSESQQTQSTPRSVHENVEVRVYPVPAAKRAAIAQLISSVQWPISQVSATGVQTNFVTPEPQFSGHTMVLSAPPSIQKGIPELIDAVVSSNPESPQSISLTFWLVRAKPSTDNTFSQELKPLTQAIGALKLPPQAYALEERLQIVTLPERDFSLQSSSAEIRGEVQSLEGHHQVELVLTYTGGDKPRRSSTHFVVTEEQYAIIGQLGNIPGDDQATLLVIAKLETNVAK